MGAHSRDKLCVIMKRGHRVAVDCGRLHITPSGEKPVPPEWLAENETPLIAEVALLAGLEALIYDSYSVGNYGRRKSGGVTLQFRSLCGSDKRYSIFNADTCRERSTKYGKRGDPLPHGQFRVTKNYKFYHFWLSTGLAMPPRLSSFHDYMGKLSSLVFTCEPCDGERRNNIHPLSIGHAHLESLLQGHLPDMIRTGAVQAPDTCRTSMPDKQRLQRQQP